MAPDLRRLNALTFFTKTDAEGWLAMEHRKIADGTWERRSRLSRPSRSHPRDLRRLHDDMGCDARHQAGDPGGY